MHGSAPFLLVGPFGTGKTRTLIEFLRRLVAHRKPGGAMADGPMAARVLVCSPSNSSVDKYATANPNPNPSPNPNPNPNLNPKPYP